MKKQYINPHVQLFSIRPMTMLAGSPVAVDPNATPGDQINAEARQYYGDFDLYDE